MASQANRTLMVGLFHVGRTEHLRTAEITCQSIKRFLPGARIAQYTDRDTPGICGVDYVFRTKNPISLDNLMVANVEAQIRSVEVSRLPHLFLDTDTMINRPGLLAELEPYDALFTWRDNLGKLSEQQPWNYGVMYLTEAALPLMHAVHEAINRLGTRERRWYGNQIALAHVMKCPYQDQRIDYAGINIRAAPCERFNYTPQTPDEDVSDKWIIHTKGNRKHMLKHYWERAQCE